LKNDEAKSKFIEQRKELNHLLASLDIEEPNMIILTRILTVLYNLVRNEEILKVPELAESYSFAANAIESISINNFPLEIYIHPTFEILNMCEEASVILEETGKVPNEFILEMQKCSKILNGLISNKWQELNQVETIKINENGHSSNENGSFQMPDLVHIPKSYEVVSPEEKDMLNDFINNTQEIISTIEDDLLVLENEPQNDALINEIFRGIHTLKGDAGFLKFGDIQILGHTFETLLGKCRNKTIIVDAEKISLFLSVIDTIKRMIKNLSLKLKLFNKEISNAIFETIDLYDPIFKMNTVINGGRVPGSSNSPKPQTNTTEATNQQKSSENVISDAIRVPQKKIEDTEEMVGELLIALSSLKLNPQIRLIRDRDAIDKIDQLEQIIELLQGNILKMKMFPIGNIFNKLSRIVRDLSQKLNKKIVFITEGADVEIDKSLIDEIYSPLMHIIRNSIDHGIEMPEVRKNNGKSETGRILLRAENRGDNVNIEIIDDGGGLNKERILEKAIEKEIIPPGSQLSDSEIYNLIMAPGFSTAEKITEISGRGVGMDVVRTTIEHFGGNLQINSEQNKGTIIQIKLPLSSSIIEGLVVACGKSKFVFPIIKIHHTLLPKSKDINYVFENNGLFIVFENRTMPLIKLGEFYQIKNFIDKPENAITIVVEFRNKYFGILVDEIIMNQKVVAKSFKDRFSNVPGIRSGTILGDGSVGFILEPSDLILKLLNENKLQMAG
jgi:two-component system, chemotaxis family, sensor kinase CheA